jgi:hypothetical protein
VLNKGVYWVIGGQKDIKIRQGAENAAGQGGPPRPYLPAQHRDTDTGAQCKLRNAIHKLQEISNDIV